MSNDDLLEDAVAGFVHSIGGELTMAGALLEHWEYISRKWHAKSTITNYLRDYKLRILPYFQEKAFLLYTPEERILIEDGIQGTGNLQESTMRHYRHLIDIVLDALRQHDPNPPTYLDASFAPERVKDPAVAMEKKRLQIPRYFTVSQQCTMHDRFYADHMQNGNDEGLLCMNETGARNNEACALDFKSFRLKNGIPVVDILNSTVGDMAVLKPGTKSANGIRTIQITEMYYAHVTARKARLAEMIARGEIAIPEESGIHTVDDMPYICNSYSWCERATPRQLSEAGKRLFQELKMTQEQMAELRSAMERDQDDPVFGNFKDPTSYANRRAVANHLADVGYDYTEIRYELGHDLEMDEVRRAYYLNNNIMSAMHEMKEHRALVGRYYRENREYMLENNEMILNNVHGGTLVIPLEGRKGQRLYLTFRSREHHVTAGINLRIDSDEDTQLRGRYRQRKLNRDPRRITDPPRPVNVLHDYWEPYRKEEARRAAEAKLDKEEKISD